MKIQKCVKCGHKFTYKERFLACLNSNYICCKNCGTRHKVTLFSKFLLFLLFMSCILLERPIIKIYHVSIMFFIILILSIMLFLFPVFVQFNLKTERKQIQNIE